MYLCMYVEMVCILYVKKNLEHSIPRDACTCTQQQQIKVLLKEYGINNTIATTSLLPTFGTSVPGRTVQYH
jgi:hypothetical protein